MRKNINKTTVQGRIHSFGENGRKMLEVKVSGDNSKAPGTEFISGIINIATDEAGLNIVPVNFTYVTATYGSSGKENKNFGILKNLITNARTWAEHGKDAATMIRVDGSLALNEFYVNENGTDRLVSAKVNEGSFVTILNTLPEDENERTEFECDMLITRCVRVEANEERGIDADYLTLGGAVFNFRNSLLPVEFTIKNPHGMAYFESLDLPTYTKVRGHINCSTIVRTVEEESAWGEAAVKTYERKVREWVIFHANKAPYEFGEEDVMTQADIEKAMQDREVYLAEIKKRADDYKASKNSGFAAPAANTTAPKAKAGNFNF